MPNREEEEQGRIARRRVSEADYQVQLAYDPQRGVGLRRLGLVDGSWNGSMAWKVG